MLCSRDEDKQKGKCFGGIARLQTAVKKLRASDKNVLWLNAGDFYQGTVWYSHFKWKVTRLSTISTQYLHSIYCRWWPGLTTCSGSTR